MRAKKRSGELRQSLTLLHGNERNYPDAPEKARLEAFPNPCVQRDYVITFNCPEFTSLCPITGQPDFGRIEIRYVPNRWCLESKSLKLYLFAYRNCGAFHEAVVNRILEDVVKAISPRRADVRGDFHARGGISIQVEASFQHSRRRRGAATRVMS
jgi:7-cyano-7-deazaguanine reductase